MHLHLDAAIPCRYLPHDYVSEIVQRNEHILKMFCSVKYCMLQKRQFPRPQLTEKRWIHFSLKPCSWIPCSFEMHPPVTMVSGTSCIFVSCLSFSSIFCVAQFWLVVLDRAVRSRESLGHLPSHIWPPEFDPKPSEHNGDYIFSTVVDAEIHCWNGKFHIRTTSSEAECKIHWPLSKTHTWAHHAPSFLCHKIHEKQRRAEWLLPPSKLLHPISLIKILQWVKPSFCPKNFLH